MSLSRISLSLSLSLVAAAALACGGPSAAAPPPAIATAQPAAAQPAAAAEPAPSCEVAVDHAMALFAAELDPMLAELTPEARETAKREIREKWDEFRADALVECRAKASDAERRCVMNARNAKELDTCKEDDEPGDATAGAATAGAPDGGATPGGDVGCDRVTDHVLALLVVEMERLLTALPADKQKEARAEFERDKDKNRDDLIARCEQQSTPATRACVMQADSFEELERCGDSP